MDIQEEIGTHEDTPGRTRNLLRTDIIYSKYCIYRRGFPSQIDSSHLRQLIPIGSKWNPKWIQLAQTRKEPSKTIETILLIENAIRMTAAESHACVEIQKFDLVGDIVWMLMPFYAGGTLTAVVDEKRREARDRPIPEDLMLNWFAQLLKCVATLHDHEVVCVRCIVVTFEINPCVQVVHRDLIGIFIF